MTLKIRGKIKNIFLLLLQLETLAVVRAGLPEQIIILEIIPADLWVIREVISNFRGLGSPQDTLTEVEVMPTGVDLFKVGLIRKPTIHRPTVNLHRILHRIFLLLGRQKIMLRMIVLIAACLILMDSAELGDKHADSVGK